VVIKLVEAMTDEQSYEARGSAPKEQIEVAVRTERRRRWSSEEKLRIVRRHFTRVRWRRWLRTGMGSGQVCFTLGASRCSLRR
jgi:hypothetical protein